MTQAANLAALGSNTNTTGILPAAGGGTAGTAGYASSFKNKLINGGFQVWQRGTSGTANNAYNSADRWYMSGGSATVAQGTLNSPNNNYSLVATATAGTYANPSQALEALNVYSLRGQYVTFSFYVKLNSGTFTGALGTVLFYSNSSDAINISTGSQSTVSGTGYITPNSSWQRVTGTYLIPADAVGLTFQMNVSAAQSNGTVWAYSDAQVELGTQATNFEQRLYGAELALCQRYFQTIASDSTAVYARFGMGYVSSANVMNVQIPLKVTMRTTPSMATTGTANNYYLASSGNIYNCNAVPTLNTFGSTPNIVSSQPTTASTMTTGYAGEMGANNASGIYLQFSAEL